MVEYTIYEDRSQIDRSLLALIELGFHDNALDSAWMLQGTAAIAKAFYQGICNYYGYEYRAFAVGVSTAASPVVPSEDRDIYLSVRVLQSKAEGLFKQIQTMGYGKVRGYARNCHMDTMTKPKKLESADIHSQ